MMMKLEDNREICASWKSKPSHVVALQALRTNAELVHGTHTQKLFAHHLTRSRFFRLPNIKNRRTAKEAAMLKSVPHVEYRVQEHNLKVQMMGK